VWRDDGHVDDVALAAIADAELDIVPDQAVRHVGACDACTARLGEQALLSLSTSEALSLLEPAAQHAPARQPIPVPAILVALTLAALGAMPAMIKLVGGIASAPELALRGFLLSSRAGAALIRAVAGAEAATWAVAWAAATAVLLVLGALIARAAPARKEAA
jgi:hypothetical protein